MALDLYHYWSSVCSQKVRFALAEKGLSWQSRHVDLFRFENWEPAYTAVNPRGLVPTLVHGGRPVIESNVIIEYLDDAFRDAALRPADAYERAAMRRWLHLVDEVVHPSIVEASFNPRHRPRLQAFPRDELLALAAKHPDPDLREGWLDRVRNGVAVEREAACYDRLERVAARMDETLAGASWLAGDALSLADVALAPYVNRIALLKHPEIVDETARPHLGRWWRRIQERPGYVEAFSFRDPGPTGSWQQ